MSSVSGTATGAAPSPGALLHFLLLPSLFAACAWWMALASSAPMLPRLPFATPTWKHDGAPSSYEKSLIPDTLWDAYRLGEISLRMRSFPDEDTASLIDEANGILNHKERYNLTAEDVMDGKLDAAIEAYCKRREKYKIFRGIFSFVGVLSIISIVGILATLWPTLKFLYMWLHLDYVWRRLIHVAAWILEAIDPLIGVVSFFVPLILVDQSLHLPANGARSQTNILAAGLAGLAFFYQVWRREDTPSRITNHNLFATVTFVWGFSFLVPLALIGNSQTLGFFAVGSIFGALGFVALPTPFGYVAGFQDEVSMDKCMMISIAIIVFSVVAKMKSFPSLRNLDIFQLGLSVFGMLSFGLAGLIKSSKASRDGYLTFGGATAIHTFVYPILWLAIGFIGSLVSYASLTNTAITFVGLWMTQFYWRIVGYTSVSVFVFSCILFYVTLQLKLHKEFIGSLLSV